MNISHAFIHISLFVLLLVAMFLNSKWSSKLSLVVFVVVLANNTEPIQCHYTSLFSFGDSLADTGNLVQLVGKNAICGKYPYGVTYFHQSTGRCSDGCLIIDFIAQALGIKYLPSYLSRNKGIQQGVNFAVTGATTMVESNASGAKNSSNHVGIQLRWFKNLLPSLCKSLAECKEFFEKSLFLMGELGGNDYIHRLGKGENILELTQIIVPLVVSTISQAVQTVIEYGTVNVVVPGMPPLGCNISAFLALLQSPDKSLYDEQTGCLTPMMNEFAEYHNLLLKTELVRLRLLNPDATIVYVDYYNAVLKIFQTPSQFGFSKGRLTKCCCGGGGEYNFNSSVLCSTIGSNVCEDSSLYVNWDGIHLTEAAYKALAKGLISGLYTDPPLKITSS